MTYSTYSDKSHVSMEQKVCFICGRTYDTGALLLDTRLQKTFERYTVTGHGQCKDCDEKINEGRIALIGVDEEKTTNPNNPWRTGELVFLREEAFKKMFNVELPPKKIAFVDKEVVNMLKEMVG